MEDSVLTYETERTADVDPETPARRVCERCGAIYRTEYPRCPLDGGALVFRPDDPLIGSTIGDRYVVLECVGEGAMGRVYRVQHNRMSRQFAVKVLFGDLAADERMRRRFAREAEAASRLSHPNVVSVVDFGETEVGILYLAMDFIEGETLGAFVARRQHIPEAEVRPIAIDIAHGLAHAHEQGLVHRDLKPENVIIERHGSKNVAKIVDFGIAFIDERQGAANARLTQSGCIVGTPAFMSPEQALGEKVGPQADLFSFGVCLYYALSGSPPFEGEAVTVLQRLMCDPLPPMTEHAPGIVVTPEFEAIIARLTARDTDERYTSAEEVLADLMPEAAVPAPAASDAALSTATLAAATGSPRWPWAAAALLLLIVGAFVVIGGAPDAEPPPTTDATTAAPTEATAVKAPIVDESAATVEPELVPVRVPADVSPESKRPEKVVRRRRPSKATDSPPPVAPPPVAPPPVVAPPPPVVASPPPPADPPDVAPGVVAIKELQVEYLAVGKALDALATAHGEAAASALRRRYFKIPFADAMRVPSLRKEAMVSLAKLRVDIARARVD